MRLPDAPGDELRVLRPEVDDENGVERRWRQSPWRNDVLGFNTFAAAERAFPALDRASGFASLPQLPIPICWSRCRFLPSVWRAGATITSAFWKSFTVW